MRTSKWFPFTKFKLSFFRLGDVPSYNYMWCTFGGIASCFFYAMRLMFMDPDVQFRKFDQRLPHPDKTHLHAYCLPYFNHRLRNMATKHMWNLGQNEPDWAERT